MLLEDWSPSPSSHTFSLLVWNCSIFVTLVEKTVNFHSCTASFSVCCMYVLYPMYKNRRIRGRVSQVSRLSQQTAVPRWWRIWRARTVRRRSPPPRCWGACRAVLQPQPCESPTGTQGQPYRRGPLWEGKALEQRFQHRHNKPDQSWE